MQDPKHGAREMNTSIPMGVSKDTVYFVTLAMPIVSLSRLKGGPSCLEMPRSTNTLPCGCCYVNAYL